MSDLETTTKEKHSIKEYVQEYFRYVKDQVEESKIRGHKGYYISNCLRVLVGMEPHNTAAGYKRYAEGNILQRD